MQFEWDAAKARMNHAKHGVEFSYATRVFLDPNRVVVEDMRKAYGESRYTVFGEIETRLYVVAFTRRREVYRLISARKGNRREQKKYRSFYA